MQKNKDGSRWKNSSKKVFKEKRDKDKSSIIFYKCKKPEHLKSEYINLENSKYKHKQYKSMGKKGLMSTQKDLDDTSSNQEGEEKANLCLMDDTTSKESESNQEEVDFNSPELLKQAYHDFISNSSIFSKAYKNLRKVVQRS